MRNNLRLLLVVPVAADRVVEPEPLARPGLRERGAVHRRVLQQVQRSWPGPNTWVFPRAADVPSWICGNHAGIALRVTAHAPAAALCRAFGAALVSTSANPHGQPPARAANTVAGYFGDALDGLLDAPLGGQTSPTTIRDALSGAIIRA